MGMKYGILSVRKDTEDIMEQILTLFQNPFLVVALASWFVAQVLKTILHMILTGKFSLERLFGDGGMPSGHSATVSSLAILSGMVYGLDSFEFAIAAVLAIIVCHDAMGVRLETGKQARLINEMQQIVEILSKKELPEVKLKEFVGHTPSQVFAGIAIGLLNGIIFYYLFYA